MVNSNGNVSAVEILAHNCIVALMNMSAVDAIPEISTMPIGSGWRVRIWDGQRLQFIGGFDAKSEAEEWVRKAMPSWLKKLQTAADRL